MRTQGKTLWYISSLLNWFEKHLKLVALEILATRLDEYTVLPLSVPPSVQDIFRHIFLSNC